MKIQLLIIPALVTLTLASCGGNQNQNQNGGTTTDTTADNADGRDGVHTISTTTQPETTSPSTPTLNIAKEVWYKWLENYDPLGMVGEDEKLTPDIISENRKHIKELSPTVAEFVASGVEPILITVACYKHNNGKWLVLEYTDGQGGGNTLNVYEYDGSTFNRLDNYFPKDFLRNIYLDEFTADGFISYEESDGNSDEVLHKWNGEKFVK